MKNRNLSFIAGLTLTVIAFGLICPAAIASAQATNGQALEIAPPVMVLTADPGQTLNTKITLRNVSNGSLVVSSQVNDFVAGGEDGTPKIIMDSDESSPYSIKDWVGSLSDMTLCLLYTSDAADDLLC